MRDVTAMDAVAAVDGGQAVKQGVKGCFDLVVASKSYHLIILKVSLCLFSSCLVDILIL